MSWAKARRRLPARRLFALALRVTLYGGVLTARVRAQSAGTVPSPTTPDGGTVVSLTDAMTAVPDLFERVEV